MRLGSGGLSSIIHHCLLGFVHCREYSDSTDQTESMRGMQKVQKCLGTFTANVLIPFFFSILRV